jgi:hypothetical protein
VDFLGFFGFFGVFWGYVGSYRDVSFFFAFWLVGGCFQWLGGSALGKNSDFTF